MAHREAREQIAQLVQTWESLSPADLREYNEENTKNVFIQPLFEALGWDFQDLSQVTAEHAVGRGRVDYAFRAKGVSRFYLEAKRLRDDLTAHEEWVEQAISYAYSRNIPWTVLTNFRQLWLFTGDIEVRRFITLDAENYLRDFEMLRLLGRHSIESGALDEEADKLGVQPPKVAVEERLYAQLSVWRETLFKQIHLYRPELSFTHVDETIQRLFNRLIFIRTCEDRRIEDPAIMPLLRAQRERRSSGNLVRGLHRAFRDFDGYYDSDLFARHVLDELHIDDEVLSEIIEGLYRVPGGLANYDFAGIGADILGRVYEQYLGRVAQIVTSRRREMQLRLDRGLKPEAAIEEVIEVVELPQRRKSQGIYYTPRWVVDYIVRETVGKFIEEHSDDPEAVHELKVLDMACGSGSFLIRAYDELLAWHAENFGRAEAEIDPHERALILRNHIFGVDLDPQAVEIARLNLLLRALAQREMLPSLADNIQVGNSLISGGADELEPYFGDDWQAKRPFGWERQFTQIMDSRGFDAIIGNPPYVRIQSLDRTEADYYRSNYESASGSFDIYVMFLEKALSLLKPGGRLGFITSGKFLKAAYGKKLQGVLRREATIERIVDLSDLKVFAEATTYPVIVIARRGRQNAKLVYASIDEATANGQTPDIAAAPTTEVGQEAITEGMWPPPNSANRSVIEKLEAASTRLGGISSSVFTGLQTSADHVYHLEQRCVRPAEVVKVYSRVMQRELELESDLLKPLLSGRHIQRYVAMPQGELLLFPYSVDGGKAELIPGDEFAERYPLCWEYLLANRETLEARESGKMRHERWYAFGRSQSLGLHDFRKFAIPRLVHRLEAFYDADAEFYLDNVDVGGVLLKDDSHNQYLYVLAVLNSKLMDWHFQQLSVPFRGGFRSANRQFIDPLPIRRIDSADAKDRQLQDAIVASVDSMLELQARLGPIRDVPTSERDDLQREVDRVDSEIDDLVYELYGLTEAERRLVEGGT